MILLTACTNTPEFETEKLKLTIDTKFQSIEQVKIFVDARDLLNRKQIDAANTAVLFVELETGQNGT